MKIKIKLEKELEVTHLLVEAEPRYWEDTTVNGVEDEYGSLIPCRSGDIWSPIIDLETGEITNWEKGNEAIVHYKVCDQGEYWLLNANGAKTVKSKGYYVPDLLAIDDDGFGDYIIMEIDKNGIIKNWKPKLTEFIKDEEI